jgi:4'-phosphopantetheinyl transferase
MSRSKAECARFSVEFPGGSKIDVHLFDLDLVGPLDEPSSLEAERARAVRFHKPEDGRRFLARRVVLRQLLGVRSGRDPLQLDSIPDEFGRPRIEGLGPLRFNTSRTGGLFAVALLEGSDTEYQPGIDIEMDRPISDAASVGRRILSESEQRGLGSDHQMDTSQLLRIWTRKEAVLKAVGRGLAIDPSLITVPCQPEASKGLDTVEVPLEGGPCAVLLQEPADEAIPDGLLLAVALATGA